MSLFCFLSTNLDFLTTILKNADNDRLLFQFSVFLFSGNIMQYFYFIFNIIYTLIPKIIFICMLNLFHCLSLSFVKIHISHGTKGS